MCWPAANPTVARKGRGKDQAGTIAKDTFDLMIVALEQLACQFICLLFCDQLSHTNFLGFCNPSSIFVGIESTYGDDPSEFVKNKEHTDFRESSKAK